MKWLACGTSEFFIMVVEGKVAGFQLEDCNLYKTDSFQDCPT